MMHTRRLQSITVLAGAFFILAGAACGDDEEEDPGTAPPATDTTDDDGNGDGAGASDGGPTPQPLDLTILHINDHHSHVEAETFTYALPESVSLTTTDDDGGALDSVIVEYGGMPALTASFAAREAASSNVLKVHAGDAITGTLFYSFFNGEADARLMNDICFDAFTLGNHEFDDGDTGLAGFLDFLADDSDDCADTPVLAANVVPAASSDIADGYIQPNTVATVDGQRIGIVGLTIAGKTKNASFPDEDTEFLDEVTTAQAQIDELTATGVNKIVLLTHYGYENDQSLAAALTGVDVIVGGDSHTLLGNATTEALGFDAGGDYPTQVTNADGDAVCVVQAWEYGHVMGELNVSFDSEGVVTSCAGQVNVPLTGNYFFENDDNPFNDPASLAEAADIMAVEAALTALTGVAVVTPDAESTSILETFQGDVAEAEMEVVGQVAEVLCVERIPGQGRSNLCAPEDTPRGGDISNLVAKAFLTVTPTADLALQNGGGVRVDVAPGELTYGEAIQVLPFSNTLVTVDMTGQQIVDTLEEALAFALDPAGSSGAYPYAAGLRFRVDASQVQGSRIGTVEVNPRVAGTWVPIDLSATYVVVTSDFIAAGRDGYVTLGTLPNEDTFTLYTQGLVDYFELQTGPVSRLPVAEYSTQEYIDVAGCNFTATPIVCLSE
ncbi:MAG: 5'-nucleotidase C-terminal domain-containing protein [Myxococcota bacterium]